MFCWIKERWGIDRFEPSLHCQDVLCLCLKSPLKPPQSADAVKHKSPRDDVLQWQPSVLSTWKKKGEAKDTSEQKKGGKRVDDCKLHLFYLHLFFILDALTRSSWASKEIVWRFQEQRIPFPLSNLTYPFSLRRILLLFFTEWHQQRKRRESIEWHESEKKNVSQAQTKGWMCVCVKRKREWEATAQR